MVKQEWGDSHLETMSVLGVPVISNREQDIGQWWKEKLAESMVTQEWGRSSWLKRGVITMKSLLLSSC